MSAAPEAVLAVPEAVLVPVLLVPVLEEPVAARIPPTGLDSEGTWMLALVAALAKAWKVLPLEGALIEPTIPLLQWFACEQ